MFLTPPKSLSQIIKIQLKGEYTMAGGYIKLTKEVSTLEEAMKNFEKITKKPNATTKTFNHERPLQSKSNMHNDNLSPSCDS